ncbi:peptide ABC transporter substrate-binding protein [Deinococcus yavapaiensis]|uniref:Peptide/nickel transport system substrate-binding protein n=1 Tax=Deinococcus yavapaiensis KR-236 TaxID=694435 RepID=A0A318S8P2_9DEIO|nr:peptide ABC transporter substrate-binding protein [Deinococcus yavapaiensis]PYE54485.1 peptide/nickel transport system substrate-binding protein [Deinococcus yavapaiensis KR-236]
MLSKSLARLGSLATITALLSFSLASAGPSDNSLVVGSAQEPTDLNYWVQNSVITTEIGNYLYRGLVYVDMDGETQPDMVTEVPSVQNGRVKISRDAKGKPTSMTVRWTLRNNAKWSDGSRITADDVIFSHKVYSDERIPVPTREGVPSSIRKIDARTFEERYNTPWVFYALGNVYPILPAQDWSDLYDRADREARGKSLTEGTSIFQKTFLSSSLVTPNGGPRTTSGPFKFSRWVRGQSLSLVRNPNYWFKPSFGEKNAIQRITYLFFANTNTLMVNILSNKVDAVANTGVEDSVQNLGILKTRARNYDVKLVSQALWEHLEINQFGNVQDVKDLGLNDKRTRQALLYAINRRGMADDLLGGLVKVSNTIVNSSSPYFDKATLGAYPYDPAKAKKMLADLGWKPGANGILERKTDDGRTVRFTLEFVTTAGNTTREKNQQYVQKNLRDVGVDVRINNAPSSVVFDDAYIQHAQDGKWKGLFEFAWSSQPLIYTGSEYAVDDPKTNDIDDYVPTKSNNFQGQNIGGWRNAEYQKLYVDLSDEFDSAKRKALVKRLQAIMVEEVPALPLYERSALLVFRKGLVNYQYNATSRYPGWNAWEIGWASRGAK